jgi:tryptophan synthase alpha chain
VIQRKQIRVNIDSSTTSNDEDRYPAMAIDNAFAKVREVRRAALMPYFPLGYPDPGISLDVIQAVAEAGADLLELGMPFSDPLADGPTIQFASQVALEHGTTPPYCLQMVATLRQRGIIQPIILMGYYNLLLVYGLEPFVDDAISAGVNGLIVPDLPPEEAGKLMSACRARGLALIFLAAPNCSSERLAYLASITQGFLYLVSLVGVTGPRQTLPENLGNFISQARRVCHTPLAVGFGICSPDQVRHVGASVEGVIVGSALIKAVQTALSNGGDPAQAAGRFIHSLRMSA